MSTLTGKQKSFVSYYLGEANFNATLAAKLAGYRATSKHSFEALGSENLMRPGIAAAIDEHFKAANMSAGEVLLELGKLARGNSKEKIKALALLSQHHGLLDGRYEKLISQRQLQNQAEYDRGWNECIAELGKDIADYNRKADESNQQKERQWQDLIDRYEHSPVAVQALTELREIMLGKREPPPKPEPVEVEIIPPQRRLQAAILNHIKAVTVVTR